MSKPDLNRLEIIAVSSQLNAILEKENQPYSLTTEQDVVRLNNRYFELTGENFFYKKATTGENPNVVSIINQLNQLITQPHSYDENIMIADKVTMLRKEYQRLTGEEFK